MPQNEKSNIYATLMLWKKSGETWTKKELLPIKSIKELSATNSVTIYMQNGEKKEISYN
jgi:hypothetical protein